MRLAVGALDRSPLAALGETLDFMRLIWAVDHALQRTSKRMETTLGVTGPQRLVVRILGRFPGIPAGHLATLLHVHPSTVTGILKRLERQGLIRRRSDPRDGRRSLLSLTDKGRVFDVASEGTVEAAIQRALERTRQEKIQAAREVLVSIAETLVSLDSHREERASAEESPTPGPARKPLRRPRSVGSS
jgi:DNA-binding MarR family transcriptional regulator